MRTFIIHLKDGTTKEVKAQTLDLALTGLDKALISYYEEPTEELKASEVLKDWVGKTISKEDSIIPRTIKVPSATNPDKTYDVVVQPNGSIWCPCIGFANRHYCWHSNYVKELLKEEKEK